MIRLLLGLLLALSAAWAQADTPVTLFKSVAGKVNFTGGQATLRRSSNSGNPCQIWTASNTVQLAVSGIPASATIMHAQLYWAGSGSAFDYDITMDGVAYSAPTARRYSSTTIGSGFTFFSGAVDVTSAVIAKRNNSYAMSGLTVNNGDPWCDSSGVQGGFSMVVVYSDAGQTFRVLNLYEGFQYLQYSSVTLTLSNFQIPSPLGSATGRVAHITWEGDDDLLASGESLTFNGTAMVDSLNPSGNQFNSKSNIDSSSTSYGVDFDAYQVASPVIASGQTSATTVYSTGQDLVLLSAEIIAVPNVAAADLEIFMTRNAPLVSGSNTTYTLQVVNNGPSVETGPVTVINTLPAKLTYVSATGTGWSCGASGQVVTCTRTGTMAVNDPASAPITLTVLVNATGSITNTAVVDGATFDYISANSTDSDTATATAPVVASYAFTDKKCTPGVAIGTGTQCVLFPWTSYLANGVPVAVPPAGSGIMPLVYITALNASGVPVAFGSATSLNFDFALICRNPASPAPAPAAAVQASFAGATLPVCASNAATPAAWSSSVSLAFASGEASTTGLSFRYNDVGIVQLYMRQTASITASGSNFVSRPELRLSNITGEIANPAAPGPSSAAFTKAGAAFTVTAGAYTATGALARNFGRETVPETFAATAVDPGVGAVQGLLNGNFVAVNTATVTGTAVGTYTWTEVGIINMTPSLKLGASSIYTSTTGVASTIGRFYPDHFDTEVTGPLLCNPPGLPALPCASLTTAAYSKQPFSTKVIARNKFDATTQNYEGSYAKTVNLSAWNASDGTVQNPPAASPGTLTASAIAAASFVNGEATLASTSYALQNAYVETSNHANNWAAPTSVHLRAIEAAGGDSVTSDRATGTVEGGLRVLTGRLFLGNAHGSNRLPLTLPVRAQYWTGTSWETTSGDSVSTVNPATPTKMSFPACKGNNCPVAPVLASSATRTLSAGVASALPFKFNALNAGAGATVEILINDAAWLPSTRGRISYGVYRSPLIYIREVF